MLVGSPVSGRQRLTELLTVGDRRGEGDDIVDDSNRIRESRAVETVVDLNRDGVESSRPLG